MAIHGLRSLDADCASQIASASASCLRWSATPALGTWAAPHGCIRIPYKPPAEAGGLISRKTRHRVALTGGCLSSASFLAGIRRLVMRFASCEAVLDEPGSAEARGADFTKNTTSCRPDRRMPVLGQFLGRHPPAGNALRILRSSFGRAVPAVIGCERRPACHAEPGEPNDPVSPDFRPGPFGSVQIPAVIDHRRSLPDPHGRAWFSNAQNCCDSGKTKGRTPREDRSFRFSGPDR